jgi:hypothetical protein
MPNAARLAAPIALALVGCAGSIAETPEARTAKHLEGIRGQAALEHAFLRAMPKGGDLHVHLGGAIYAETYARWAIEDGLCVRASPPALLEPPCNPPASEPATRLERDPALYRSLVDTLSMRNFDFAHGSGHDHFFDAFAAMENHPSRTGDGLAEVVSRLGHQRTFYVEVMQSLGVGAARPIGRAAGYTPDLAAMDARLPREAIAKLVADARGKLDAEEARMRATLRCGRPDEDAGCKVTVRYLATSLRTYPREEVYAELATAVAIAGADARVVGVNLAAPEDDPVARRDYADHMRFVDHLTDHGKRVAVSLHAGELTPSLVPPEDTRSHVRDAVLVAGARRIGHGTDLAFEEGAHDTARAMAKAGVALEACLTSADAILGVRGAAHPWALYRQAGVPITLCTDDEGVSRTDLSREYRRALDAYALGWVDLKTIARDAIERSFLPGASLWQGAGPQARVTAACAADAPGAAAPSAACKALLDASDRAREAWRLEGLLAEFERRW